MSTWLVTGGAGFIGGNFVLDAVQNGVRVVNLDALTYAGNLDTLAALASDPAHIFVKGDIGDRDLLAKLKITYSGTNGAEFMHISDAAQRRWLQDRFHPTARAGRDVTASWRSL